MWLWSTVLALSSATVQVDSFGTDAAAAELRRDVAAELRRHGLEVRSGPKPGMAPDFVVEGEVSAGRGGTSLRIVVREPGVEPALASFEAIRSEGERLLPIVLPMAVAQAIDERLFPPPPPSEDELEILAHLDDEPLPPLDPCLEGCCYPKGPEVRFLPSLEADLRDDFAEFCRLTPRQRRRRGEPADLRPMCRQGPVFGYVRPWTWASGAATIAAGMATGISFGLRASGWQTGGLQLGDHRLGATLTTWGVTSAALTGALLTTTVALIVSDRRRARRFIRTEKRLRALED